MTHLAPADEVELAAIVSESAASKTPLAIEGGGTRGGLGRPMQTAATLSTARMSGITLYEPTELVLSARAGTPLAEVEALLADNGQRLAFEPPDHRELYGSTGVPTIGAIAAANISGSRRIQVGAARDSLIGIRAVNGRGEATKSGGRVMKNVTGYDLVKFLAGSYGTLAVLSEVTFKVLPAPETEATLVITGLDDNRAVGAMSTALGSPFSITGAAHLPAHGGTPAHTFIRLEGFTASVAARAEKLRELLADFGTAELLDPVSTSVEWSGIGNAAALGAARDTPIWRVAVKPTDGPRIAEAARLAFDCRILYDWGGGLVWIAGGEGPDAGAAAIRAAAKSVGGHATLIRAPEPTRLAVDVFEPLPPALMTLTKKLKESFDPAGILNPGRMYAGI